MKSIVDLNLPKEEQRGIDEDIPTEPLPPSLQHEDDAVVKLKSKEVRIGPMARACTKRELASHEEKRSSGREAGHGAGHEVGHEDIPWTREGGEGGMHEVGRSSLGRCTACDAKIVNQKQKDAVDVMTWREYEALRNEMRREFGEQGQKLNDDIGNVTKTLDTINETVNTIQVQVMDIQRSIQVLQLAVENLTQQQQQHEDEDADLEEQPTARGIGRGNSGRGFVELGGHRVPPQQQDDGLGKPKFSIPKFEGGPDVEEYLTWEMKIENLWRLHDYTEDRKINLASSEFDGYALLWWDGITRARQEDEELTVLTSREMKAIMQAHFVPTNYLQSIYDKLTLLRQGVMTVDAYYMEMEMLMQRGRVHDVDLYAPEDDDYESDGVDAYPSEARTIVVSQCALNVQPIASTQRCNLFQTKALVGPDKGCKVIIDGGSCRNLASK
ncbi:hypothetical protein QYE76_035661 [Lolium multiflorum]|uniref:Retrotransposon gag domain-containing protein n=1 Tax=Lolium multiflorum TaxID=4521 RepID=A0AAD8VPF3_LOLMU|nr:hypothetical protein QYE76_035661 [Lolium multiflorum]